MNCNGCGNCRTEEPSQQRFAGHEPPVAFDVDRGRDRLLQLAQRRWAADALQLALSLQLDPHGQRIDRLVALEQRANGVEDTLVPWEVEVLRTDEVGDADDRVAVDEERPEHPRLRRRIVRRSDRGRRQGHRRQQCVARGRCARVLPTNFSAKFSTVPGLPSAAQGAAS